jgi:hypothetical protein
MIDLTEIDTDTLESMTIFLADDYREDKTQYTSYGSPFSWMRTEFEIIGVRRQIANMKKSKMKEEMFRGELINLLRRTCGWKNGKSAEKRMRDAREIFVYLDLEKEFEAELE